MAFEQLEIQISDNAEQAANGLDALTATLNKLKSATSNSAGLSKVATMLEKVKTAAIGINGVNLDAFGGKLASFQSKLSTFNAAMGELGKNNLTSFVNSLNKIPDLTEKLKATDMDALATSVQKVADAMRPLATEMEKISMGFSAMPKRIQSFITQMERSGKGATTAAKGYKSAANGLALLNQKFNLGVLYAGMRRLASIMGDFVENSNQYVEDMNLFTVSMGEFADAAYEYAQSAQELMGIDAGQFMRNQGFFQSIASGFGVAADQSAVLSQNLAQLGYDLASFYNSDVETAMQKLQSGLAGELEPLRRWGFALDQITLQETARAHGIEMSIREMNQAQKAQIRYIAIMEQSVNAQHDMARTLETPANSMRILSQQITLLGRSIGNVLIPMLSAVLPYAIAAAKALRAMMDSIAAFFGYKLPTIDYDAFGGMEVGASAAEDIESAIGGAAADAKKMRDYVLGIDELNILRPDDNNDSGGAGGGAGGGLGSGFDDLKLPQYDFLKGLESQADGLIDKMKEWLKVVGLLVAAFAMFKLGKFLSSLGKAVPLLGKLGTFFKTAALALVSFTGGFLVGGELFKLFTGELQGLSAELVIGTGLMVGGTIALTAMLGPIGLAIGLAASLAGVIVGIGNAQAEAQKKGFDAIFYGGVGAAISDVADQYVSMFDAVTNANQPIIENAAIIAESKENIKGLSIEISTLINGISNGALSVEETLPRITSAFYELERETKTVLDTIYANISYALAGSVGNALEEMGYAIPEIMNLVGGILGETEQTYAALSAEFDNLMAQAATTGLTDALLQEMDSVQRQMAALTTEIPQEITNFNAAISAASLENLDFESPEAFATAMERIGESSQAAKDSIENSTNGILNDWETLLNLATDPGDIAFIENIMASIQRDSQSQQAAIDAQMQRVGQQIQESFIQYYGQSLAEAEPTILEQLESFTTGIPVDTFVAARVLESQSELSEAFESTFEQYGLDSMAGLVAGFTFGEDGAYQSIEQIMENIDRAIHDGVFDFGSPSHRMEDYGEWMTEGLTQGILANEDAPVDAFKNMLNRMLDAFQSFSTNLASGINQTMGGMAAAMSSMQVSNGSVSYASPMGNVSIPHLANGGIVKSGQLFVGRENGPELVGNFGSRTGVMNNGQIVEAVSAGVYEAVSAAMAGQNDDSQPIVIQLDGRTIYESNVRQDQSYGYAGFRQTAVNMG